jgi:lysozyme
VGVSGLILSIAGGALLLASEGLRTDAYLDNGGVPTIGVGHTAGVRLGDTITRSDAMEMFEKEASRFGAAIKRCVKVPLYQHEYDAYLSFAYNVGETAFCNSTLVKKLNAYDYLGACSELKRWTYVKGKDCRARSNNCYGIVVRRENEYRMCIGAIE